MTIAATRFPPPTPPVHRSRTLLRLAGTTLAIGLLAGGCRPRAPRNVLLVTLDTTRADHIGAYGDPAARTPTLDRLAAEGVRCANAATAAPITLPSHSTILTGLLPPATGVRDNGSYALGDDAITLAERLRDAGYNTQAFISALVLARRYGLAQGFEGYDDDLYAEDEPKLFMIRKRVGPRTAARAVDWLELWAKDPQRKPFFVWTHFFDAHQPYLAPAWQKMMAPSPYDAEISVEDAALGTLLDELRKLGELDRTLVVVVADHGESLGEHAEKTHAIFVYDATVHVPLVFSGPGLPRGKVYAAPVRTADITPTVLGALGLAPLKVADGTNLWPALRGEAPAPSFPQYCESLLSEVGFGMAPLFGLRADGWKWIRAPKPELYDLEADPGELHNLYAQQPRRAAALDRELEETVADAKRHVLRAQRNALDRETQEMLQALGYLAPKSERESMSGMDPKDGILLYNQLEDARHLAQRARWTDAERLLHGLLQELPGNLTAQNILALTLVKQGDFAGARREYARSLEMDGKQFRVYAMLGALALQEGKLDEAERLYRKGLEVSPGFVEAMSSLGMIAALRGDPATAKSWYEKATETDPAYPRPYRRLGDLYYEQGDWPRALHWYKLSLRSNRHDFAALVQAGNAARRAGEIREATHHFRRASRLRPDSWIPFYNLACLEALQGETAKALAALDEARRKGLRRVALLEQDKDLQGLRADPGFQKLVAEVKAGAGRSPDAHADDEEARAVLGDDD